ncbi:hypothetical protein M407DRAFT_241311 [Tulasnella calospora MUT 4182]|uniref:CoA-binding domain-containing protein n=1 Tax=Tulasnella calospora MUT 4182 TaxID=1051891 RepID=A0A0C3MFU3_9AGAM|nr:hypothetical protein M407DRAFT_241311 [Tulasnella calospora MUT 4182]
MPTTAEIQRLFLSSPKYAVVGASKDPSKYGTRVLKWYIACKKDVTPIHHKESSLEEIPTLKTLKDLPSPTTASVSIITPPKVTLGILQEAKALGVPALWLQPGAEDDEVRQYVNDNLSDRVILGGPCILVSGDKILESLTR